MPCASWKVDYIIDTNNSTETVGEILFSDCKARRQKDLSTCGYMRYVLLNDKTRRIRPDEKILTTKMWGRKFIDPSVAAKEKYYVVHAVPGLRHG